MKGLKRILRLLVISFSPDALGRTLTLLSAYIYIGQKYLTLRLMLMKVKWFEKWYKVVDIYTKINGPAFWLACVVVYILEFKYPRSDTEFWIGKFLRIWGNWVTKLLLMIIDVVVVLTVVRCLYTVSSDLIEILAAPLMRVSYRRFSSNSICKEEEGYVDGEFPEGGKYSKDFVGGEYNHHDDGWKNHIGENWGKSDFRDYVPYSDLGLKELFRDVNNSEFEFKDNNYAENLESIENFKNDILTIVEDIEAVNRRGYINSTDLSVYPVIGDLINPFVKLFDKTQGEEIEIAKDEGLYTRIRIIKEKEKELTEFDKVKLAKWFYCLTNLNLYYLSIKFIKKLNELVKEGKMESSEEIEDLKTDLLVIQDSLWNSIDKSVREKIRQRGLSIIKNVYVGYDTEYKNKGNKNEIVSSQWAVTSRIELKMPRFTDFTLSSMNTHSGERYKLEDRKRTINYRSLGDVIDGYIKKIRKEKIGRNDAYLSNISESLKSRSVKWYEDDNDTVFAFDYTSGKTHFRTYKEYPLKEMTFKDLIGVGNNLIENEVELAYQDVITLLKEIRMELDSEEDIEPIYFSEVETDLEGNPIETEEKEVPEINMESKASEIEFKEVGEVEVRELKEKWVKKYKRTRNTSYTPDKVSVTVKKKMYLMGHMLYTDLSFLSDFEKVKNEFDLVQKFLVTRGPGFYVGETEVNLRDTVLITPPGKNGSRGLTILGKLYKMEKLELSEKEYKDMKSFLEKEYEKFKEYAINDAKIVLVHGCKMADVNFGIGGKGVPLTLSSLSGRYITNSWKILGYKGYQVNPEYLLSDSKSLTPEGLERLNKIGLILNYYMKSYKGGRNESYMYGMSKDRTFVDYDFKSAYTSVMCMMGNPLYKRFRQLKYNEFQRLTDFELVNSFTIIDCKFEFVKNTKFPSIASTYNGVITYPLRGEATITGLEYVVARNQGCKISINNVGVIPWETPKDYPNVNAIGESEIDESEATVQTSEKSKEFTFETYNKKYGYSKGDKGYLEVGVEERYVDEKSKQEKIRYKGGSSKSDVSFARWRWVAFPHGKDINKDFNKLFVNMPFHKVIKKLIECRGKFGKGTVENLLYKILGNGGYGLTAQGLNCKNKFDIKLGRTIRVEGGRLSNPIIASWITAYMRSLLGEMLHEISLMKGEKVISATTDGFLTTVKNLEEVVLNKERGFTLLKQYRKSRVEITGDAEALEIKTETEGLVIAGAVRNQFNKAGGLKALTGLQTGSMSMEEVEEVLIKAMKSKKKEMEFVAHELTSGIEIYKYGGHVVSKNRDQKFRLLYDNRRIIIENPKTVDFREDTVLLDTRPINRAIDANTLKEYAKIPYTRSYYKNSSTPTINKYKGGSLEIAVRTWLKDLFNKNNNLTYEVFRRYSDIVSWLRVFEKINCVKIGVKLCSDYISKVKIRGFSVKVNKVVPVTEDTIAFAEYIKESFPGFEREKFLKG